MFVLIAMIGALAAPQITPLTDEAMELIEPGLQCSATTNAGETVFLTDGALALIGINGQATRVRDADDTMGLPEQMSGNDIVVTIKARGPGVFVEEEERSYEPAELVVETQSGVSRLIVQYSCAA